MAARTVVRGVTVRGVDGAAATRARVLEVADVRVLEVAMPEVADGGDQGGGADSLLGWEHRPPVMLLIPRRGWPGSARSCVMPSRWPDGSHRAAAQ